MKHFKKKTPRQRTLELVKEQHKKKTVLVQVGDKLWIEKEIQ